MQAVRPLRALVGLKLPVAIALGVLTTLAVACFGPHLWFLALRPEWTVMDEWPLDPKRLTQIWGRSRPLIDSYAVTISPLAATVDPAGPFPIPTGVRLQPDPAKYPNVATAVSGWPWRAMAMEAWQPSTGPVEYQCCFQLGTYDSEPVLFPLRPLASGFAADTAVFAAIWFGVLQLPIVSPAWWRAGRRLRRGHCPSCGYDLRFAMRAGCNECGWRKHG